MRLHAHPAITRVGKRNHAWHVTVAGTLAYLPDGEVLVAATGSPVLAGELWDGNARWVAVAARRVLVVVNPRIIDIYSPMSEELKTVPKRTDRRPELISVR